MRSTSRMVLTVVEHTSNCSQTLVISVWLVEKFYSTMLSELG